MDVPVQPPQAPLSLASPSPHSEATILHPTCLSLNALPPELIGIILAYVPLRPRLLIASTVCQRWRAIALRVPTALPPLRPRQAALALELLPHVTRMYATLLPQRTCLRSLRHLNYRGTKVPALVPFAQLSSLTALSVMCGHKAEVSAADGTVIARLVRNCAVSLTSLTLDDLRDVPIVVADVYLTHLRHLSLSLAKRGRVGASELLATHSTQLTSLRILRLGRARSDSPAISSPVEVVGLRYPLLREAFVHTELSQEDVDLARFTSNAPALTSLQLNLRRYAPASLLPYATSLKALHLRQLQRLDIGPCTRLTKLYSSAPLSDVLALGYAANLRSLMCVVGTGDALVAALAHMTSLKKLRLQIVPSSAASLVGVALPASPRLRQVTLDVMAANLQGPSIALLRSFLAANGVNPIREIKVLSVPDAPDVAWAALLAEAERRGVESFRTQPSVVPSSQRRLYRSMYVV